MVFLEDLVPSEHLLRKIDVAIDFKRIYDFVEDLYSEENDNPYYVDETVTRTILHIERSTMSAYEAADYFSFKKKQREYLDTLMSHEFDKMWAVLVD